MKKSWRVPGLAVICLAGGMGWGQTTAAPATNVAPAAPVVSAKEISAMEAKLADWPQLARYREANATLAPVAQGEQRVVFYGDSITDGWGRRPDTGDFFPGKPYVNRGISGQTTPQMVVRFRQDVINLRPAAVVILAGTNDVAGNTGPMTPEMTEDNFRSMIDLAKANGIRVIVASITPAADITHIGGTPEDDPLRCHCCAGNLVAAVLFKLAIDSFDLVETRIFERREPLGDVS